MAVWTAPRIWDGGTAFIIGGGPSLPRQFNVPEEIIQEVMKGRLQPDAYSPYMSSIHDKHIIAVNNAYKLGDWIDVLFFGDSGWYVVYRNVLPNLQMLKVTCCVRFAKPDKYCQGIKYLAWDKKIYGLTTDPTKVCWNSNSGAAAINLAVHFGVKRIVLLGFDMKLDHNKTSHWFGSYNRNNPKPAVPPFSRHLKGFDAIKADLDALGIEVLNCSAESAITQFRKCTIEEVLAMEANHATDEGNSSS